MVATPFYEITSMGVLISLELVKFTGTPQPTPLHLANGLPHIFFSALLCLGKLTEAASKYLLHKESLQLFASAVVGACNLGKKRERMDEVISWAATSGET